MISLRWLVIATFALSLAGVHACSTGGGGGKSDAAAEDIWADGMCKPNCENSDCGDDGCGGNCGKCGAGKICNDYDQCVELPSCQIVSQIKCDETLLGDTTAADSLLSDYACENYEGNAAEAVYIFVANMDDTVTFTLDAPSEQMDILVTDTACDPGTCLGMGDTEVELQVKGGQKYYLIVDGQEQASGPYSVALNCLSGCQPDCNDKECGDDGCGGDCGTCPNAAPYCVQGECAVDCTADCTEKQCGDDGCGTPCGQCLPGTSCKDFVCVPDQCEPNCQGKVCGNDGCGGSCGQCQLPLVCSNGQCIEGGGAGCAPLDYAGCDGCACEACVCEMDAFCCDSQWDNLCADECAQCGFCGDEPCGNEVCMGEENCTTCPQDCPCPLGSQCVEGICSDCTPSCGGKECGDDGCGGQCGTCPAGTSCQDFACVDTPVGDGCVPSTQPGCGGCPCEACVCELDPYCCESSWDGICVDECTNDCGGCKTTLGEFGDPCTQHDECESGICAIEYGFCTQTCFEECPAGFQCQIYDIFEPDIMFVCLPPCLPDCQEKQCGDDGCGSTCGQCDEYEECVDYQCEGDEPVPCINLEPANVDFGNVLVGDLASKDLTIGACGEMPLELYGFEFKAGSSENIGVDFSALPHIPALYNPVVLEPGQAVTVSVMYLPSTPSPTGDDGTPIPETATLQVVSDAEQGIEEVGISGVAVGAFCPTAVITCQEGNQVVPPGKLHLDGLESFSEAGAVNTWEWSVTQPVGSVSKFMPSSTFPSPTFEVKVAGQYTFYLDVWDESGIPSCTAAQYEVAVIPDAAIHVELTWTTPGDPDESDQGPEAGTDLDLHFANAFATGFDVTGDGINEPWFDMPFDCFWFNPNPNWGQVAPDAGDDPSVQQDDTDGAGPEIIILGKPEDMTYRIGVHFWSDHGFGNALARLRVYFYGELVFEQDEIDMVNQDMWEAVNIDWGESQVTPVTGEDGGPLILHEYDNPLFN